MRPVPLVRLLFAFIPQLNLRIFEAGYPHEEHVLFWMWNVRRPHRRHVVCDLLVRFPKLVVPFVCMIR